MVLRAGRRTCPPPSVDCGGARHCDHHVEVDREALRISNWCVGRCTCVHQPNASGACHRSPGIRLHDARWGPKSAAGRPSACQQPHEEGHPAAVRPRASVRCWHPSDHGFPCRGTFHLGLHPTLMATVLGFRSGRRIGPAPPLARARRIVDDSRSTDAIGRNAAGRVRLASGFWRSNGVRLVADSSHGAWLVAVPAGRSPNRAGPHCGTACALADDLDLRLMGVHPLWVVCPPCGCDRSRPRAGPPLAPLAAAGAVAAGVPIGTGRLGR